MPETLKISELAPDQLCFLKTVALTLAKNQADTDGVPFDLMPADVDLPDTPSLAGDPFQIDPTPFQALADHSAQHPFPNDQTGPLFDAAVAALPFRIMVLDDDDDECCEHCLGDLMPDDEAYCAQCSEILGEDDDDEDEPRDDGLPLGEILRNHKEG